MEPGQGPPAPGGSSRACRWVFHAPAGDFRVSRGVFLPSPLAASSLALVALCRAPRRAPWRAPRPPACLAGTYFTHEAKGADDAADADTAIINAEGGQNNSEEKKEYFI